MRTAVRGWGRAVLAVGLTLGAAVLVYIAAVLIEARALGDRMGPERYPLPAEAHDATGRYAGLMASEFGPPRAFARIQDRLAGVAVIFVPSFLGDQLATAQAIGLAPDSQEPTLLRSLGLPVILPDLDTEAPSSENGRLLAELVAARARPVCFVSHSKGGLDTLAALLMMEPRMRALVRCWIALQAPMAGTPVADLRAGSAVLQAMTEPLMLLLGGSGRTLDEMTTPARREDLARQRAAIAALAREVPILAVGTAANGPGVPSALFAPFHAWMADAGILNDGMVPMHTAALPHARYVMIAGMDHLSPFSERQLQALFAMVMGE
jgi:hypothetical protein